MEWKLFADLAEVAGGDRIAVSVPGDATVGDALDALLDDRPALRERVLDETGSLYDHVNLLRNGRDAALDEELEAGDELALFPPVSGG
ncbi:molybdenum cofactor biosynthesis protein moaD [Halarchaeum acidiphilum MH1-52-1]|uniref:Molybdenum cofactor biosynthesis protein moaD n=1 Tax=Halarchaeum acidiphilum MH1-52-1 TaxID=1261545 RepID=U2YW54_9EURY|nr:ubiquitin-like small modifier protein 1 [Halarchaeum acidiphilum]GAD53260.1 molybdenum cofactor biosynthesis protein moaD [Halarchaeum acidiphilum MH1-52-1]